jgi:hypothetical protein
MRQIETSRTLVFGAPRRARAFFEALAADNLDLGRPDSVELLFTGKRPGGRGRPVKPGVACKTKVVTRDTEVTINAFFKHSRVSSTSKTAARCGSRSRGNQHLPADPRRTARRIVLHQDPHRLLRPLLAADTPARTGRATPRPRHHRPARPHLHRPCPPRQHRLKTQDQPKSPVHEGALKVPYTKARRSASG